MRLNPRSNAEMLLVLILAAFLFFLIPKEWIVVAPQTIGNIRAVSESV
jgi:hypothetical protein